jgi:hypothetical protein
MDQPAQSLHLKDVIKVWPHLVRALRKEKVFLAECLSAGTPVAIRGQVIEVGFPPANEFQREHVMDPAHLKRIETMAQRMLSPGIKVLATVVEHASAQPDTPILEDAVPASSEPEEEDQTAEFHDFVQSAMDVFNGRIVRHDE